MLSNLISKAHHAVYRWHLNPVGTALRYCLRWHSSKENVSARIRNIGIIAHIDAGKTTTTESMLYHAGKIHRMGKVDSGNTVTDYLPSERDRGITVQSAAVSFNWRKHFINLIDTPGHVDFTIEVERALNVLDGAVAVVDGTRGVEAQTRMVWRQADKIDVPRMVFVNKMDKPGADLIATVESLKYHLSAKPVILHYPIMKNEIFSGVADIVNMLIITNEDGSRQLKQCNEVELYNKCIGLRKMLIEQLSDIDDEIAEMYLNTYLENESEFPSDKLENSLKKAVLKSGIVPVLCGSAFKDIGVTSLLDSVVKFLPSHDESRMASLINKSDRLVAYAFKVLHHKRLGPVVFIRVLTGKVHAKSKIYNATKSEDEESNSIFRVFADEYKAISEASEGDIVAITGLKKTGTGDTLHASKHDKSRILSTIAVPHPVYFCTIEGNSPTEAKALENSLAIITREDPSIQLKKDSSSGQTTICGMGELHMDILIERLRKEFNVQCYIGPIHVAYREQINAKVKESLVYQRKILDRNHIIKMTLSGMPNTNLYHCAIRMGNFSIAPEIAKSIKDGIRQACTSGPLLGYPLINSEIKVQDINISSNCPSTIVTAAAVCITNELLEKADCSVLEPVMDIDIVTNEENLSKILKCLAQKHADIRRIDGESQEKHISARAPVSEMLGFASLVRKISSGNADLTMKVAGYADVPNEDIETLRCRLRGLNV